MQKRYKIKFVIQHGGHEYDRSQFFGLTEVPQAKESVELALRLFFAESQLTSAIDEYERNGSVLLPDGERIVTRIGHELDYWAMVEQP